MKTIFFIVLFGSLILGFIATIYSRANSPTQDGPGWLFNSMILFVILGLPILLISFIVNSMM